MTRAADARLALRGLAALLGIGAASASAGTFELSLERSPSVYRPDEQPRLRYAADVAATLRVLDWRGEVLKRIELSAAKTEISLEALPPGYYEIELGESAGARRALAVLEPAPALSRTFGVMTHFAQGWSTDIVPSIARAGIGTVRDEQYWAQIEPQPGEYVYPDRYARYMQALRQADIEPLLVLSFANQHYDEGKTPFSPTGRAAFAAYGAELARRHDGQVAALEVWNEINGTFCSGPCRQDRAGTYAALLADTYAALKAVHPDLTVVGGAAVKVPLPWFDALIARGAMAHWDAVAVHPYGDEPENTVLDVAALQQRLRAAGSHAPIWATEFGTGAGRADAAARRATAAYLVRMAVVLRAAGVERMYWYLLRDYQNFNGMGLLRGERDPLGRLAPTPAYVAYATLIRLLDGADSVTREPSDPRTHIYRFERGGEATYVLWAPDGPIAVSADLPAGAQLTDLVGQTQTLSAGNRTVTLDHDPQYLRGTVQNLDATRPDALEADAHADFSVAASDGRWQYGAYLMPPPTGTGVCAPPDAEPIDLRVRQNAWESFYGDPRWPALRIGAGTQHPARSQGRAVWAARRYRSDVAGSVQVRGAFSRNGKGDGAGACILVDGKPVFEALLPPGAQQQAEFNLSVQLPAGGYLEFVVTPGRALDINNDAVAVAARVSRPRASQ